MAREMNTRLVGELHCMNCGRTLATVARDGLRGTLCLQPARYQTAVQVTVAGRQLLRCKHCQGRALLEPFADPDAELAGTLALAGP
jgi:hypothetical protein